ncbi:MAG TPA: corrinoid protein-associated methyltransferase CpaM, partial [Anaerolineales bacterium]|nr:corrinoid protein-associated methyltransferase CpaM [Anaerolineales bacterium]
MATVFMKWLETSPKTYDRGIQLLTLGRLKRAHQHILDSHIQPGMRVLEIGCGTGALAVQTAEKGAQVVGIDLSPQMLGAASPRIRQHELEKSVALKLMDAALIADTFKPQSFDRIVASLSLSEMTPEAQQYVLASCHNLLTPGGQLVVVDEVRPTKPLARLGYALARLPLTALTWLLTRATTHPQKALTPLLETSGYQVQTEAEYLLGSLVLLTAEPVEAPAPQRFVAGQLAYRPTLITFLKDSLSLFNRLIPPYPKQRPGLYRLGNPIPKSPVLATGNFDLTVRRLTKALDGKVDAWVLVVDTAG